MSVMTGKSHLQSNGSLVGPLSPIQADRNYRIFFFFIYAVVADLFNMAIINDPDFKGHETTEGNFLKISAYADDTAVHIGQTLGITRAQRHLGRYSRPLEEKPTSPNPRQCC